MGDEAKKDEQRFEAVLEELEQMVSRLEQGNLPLGEALAAFERGMKLAGRADERLSAAEERIEALVGGGKDGVATRPATLPFQEQFPDVDLAPTDGPL